MTITSWVRERQPRRAVLALQSGVDVRGSPSRGLVLAAEADKFDVEAYDVEVGVDLEIVEARGPFQPASEEGVVGAVDDLVWCGLDMEGGGECGGGTSACAGWVEGEVFPCARGIGGEILACTGWVVDFRKIDARDVGVREVDVGVVHVGIVDFGEVLTLGGVDGAGEERWREEQDGGGEECGFHFGGGEGTLMGDSGGYVVWECRRER